MIEQNIYSRATKANEFVSRPGFGCVAYTKGISPELKALLEPYCKYDVEKPIVLKGQENVWPLRLMKYPLADGNVVLSQTAPLMQERMTMVCHQYILTGDAVEVLRTNPETVANVTYVDYDIELKKYEISMLNELPADECQSNPADMEARLALLLNWGINSEMFKQLLYALYDCIESNRRLYFVVNQDQYEIHEISRYLLPLLLVSLPYEYRIRLGYNTYHTAKCNFKNIQIAFVYSGSIKLEAGNRCYIDGVNVMYDYVYKDGILLHHARNENKKNPERLSQFIDLVITPYYMQPDCIRQIKERVNYYHGKAAELSHEQRICLSTYDAIFAAEMIQQQEEVPIPNYRILTYTLIRLEKNNNDFSQHRYLKTLLVYIQDRGLLGICKEDCLFLGDIYNQLKSSELKEIIRNWFLDLCGIWIDGKAHELFLLLHEVFAEIEADGLGWCLMFDYHPVILYEFFQHELMKWEDIPGLCQCVIEINQMFDGILDDASLLTKGNIKQGMQSFFADKIQENPVTSLKTIESLYILNKKIDNKNQTFLKLLIETAIDFAISGISFTKDTFRWLKEQDVEVLSDTSRLSREHKIYVLISRILKTPGRINTEAVLNGFDRDKSLLEMVKSWLREMGKRNVFVLAEENYELFVFIFNLRNKNADFAGMAEILLNQPMSMESFASWYLTGFSANEWQSRALLRKELSIAFMEISLIGLYQDNKKRLKKKIRMKNIQDILRQPEIREAIPEACEILGQWLEQEHLLSKVTLFIKNSVSKKAGD